MLKAHERRVKYHNYCTQLCIIIGYSYVNKYMHAKDEIFCNDECYMLISINGDEGCYGCAGCIDARGNKASNVPLRI